MFPKLFRIMTVDKIDMDRTS